MKHLLGFAAVIAIAALSLVAAGNPNHGKKLPGTVEVCQTIIGGDCSANTEPLHVGIASAVRGCGYEPGTAEVVDDSRVDYGGASLGFRDTGTVNIGADGCMLWDYTPCRHLPSDRSWTELHDLQFFQHSHNRWVLMGHIYQDVFSYWYESQFECNGSIVELDEVQ